MKLLKTFALVGFAVIAILAFTDTGYSRAESPYDEPSFNGRFSAREALIKATFPRTV